MTTSGPTGLLGPVHVVGCGLLGTSVGLALRRVGVEVWLSDLDPDHVRTAAGLGAGVPAPKRGAPKLVVVAVPPVAIADAVVDALATGAFVTDVGSVKVDPLTRVATRVDAQTLARYCGGHPMAGGERSGPLAATASLFDGRPWAVTAHPGTDEKAQVLTVMLAQACGATVIAMPPEMHDQAVARTSHLPHLMAVLTAGQLTGVADFELALAGQGVRDVTRIAASDPALWQQIIAGNATAVRALLSDVRRDLDALIGAIDEGRGGQGLVPILERGNAGTAAIPGKHGGDPLTTASVYVAVPDHPGELARLFQVVGEIGVNIEDVFIDHDPGRPVGLTELLVAASAADGLRDALESRDWTVHR